MADARLTKDDVEALLADLPGWTLSGEQLHRRFAFADFSTAIGFMVRVALACEQLDHHPNWYNVYNRVDVQLWTHNAGGVTALDLRLAQRMNEIAAKMGEGTN
jgi:4a-hydroxytetrahydrobiopterin dehydratase